VKVPPVCDQQMGTLGRHTTEFSVRDSRQW
jgi:hypothetical protein